MTVMVNDNVAKWLKAQSGDQILKQFNTKCSEIMADKFTTWRHFGKSNNIYDYRVTGNYRAVATRSSTTFTVAAIYKHAPRRGKEFVSGQRIDNY